VLIQGASGTGKELIAHLIHNNSPRRERPFVVVNCASIPDTLLESELFGHEKGAFTGAYTTKQGLAEVAHGGTLFLDEVGDISPAIQPKLLRFLETGNFRRVGSVNELNVDVRIISATNKNLEQEARAGRFREDLLYRLNVVTLHVPPLRERKEDIPLLVDHFLKLKAKSKTPKTMSPEAMELLLQHDWPGNIRELEHVIEGAIIMSHEDVIQPKDLLLSTSSTAASAISSPTTVIGDNNTRDILPIEEVEKRHIEAALKHFKGNRTKTAQSLRISQKTLYLKIKRYGIRVE
jgi:transcriptional regulator with PAS, ATPase and Fis domain